MVPCPLQCLDEVQYSPGRYTLIPYPSRMGSPTGVLIIQLGTPDAPDTPSLKRYLKQFLGDPRVIDAPRVRWWFILNFIILRTRPRQSAEKYRRIWHPERGSPLLYYTRRQADALQRLLPNAVVRYGMQVGNPSVARVVTEMIGEGIDRLVVLPMYPQYSATTTASAYDTLFKALMNARRVPALRVVPPYYDHPAYLEAQIAVMREALNIPGVRPEHYLLSFHGLPLEYVEKGDPYPGQVMSTTRLLLERLQWPEGSWTLTFQSRFGRKPWLEPYTEDTLKRLAGRGVKRVFVATPGFTADCLETLDEIGHEAAQAFRHAGGEELYSCPCLNDHPAWIQAMATLVNEQGQEWL